MDELDFQIVKLYFSEVQEEYMRFDIIRRLVQKGGLDTERINYATYKRFMRTYVLKMITELFEKENKDL